MNIGELIKKRRIETGVSQKKLAEKLDITPVMISQYETGKRNPKLETLEKIANALGCDAFDLIPKSELTLEQEKELDRQYKESIDLYKMQFMGYDAFTSDAEIRTRKAFSKLNSKGQEKAAEQVELLAKIPEYRKKDDAPVLNAAPDQKKNADDIMKNSNEWN